jgi:hypothetical protein
MTNLVKQQYNPTRLQDNQTFLTLLWCSSTYPHLWGYNGHNRANDYISSSALDAGGARFIPHFFAEFACAGDLSKRTHCPFIFHADRDLLRTQRTEGSPTREMDRPGGLSYPKDTRAIVAEEGSASWVNNSKSLIGLDLRKKKNPECYG